MRWFEFVAAGCLMLPVSGLVATHGAEASSGLRSASIYPHRTELTLADYLQRVLDYNESIQARLVAFLAARDQQKAETGIFEPAWVVSGEFVDRQRPNTIEIERSLRSGGEFVERNDIYNTAIEFRTPLGTRVRLGSGGRILRNNVQRTVLVDLDAEYEASVGVTIEHSLMKNSGRAAVLAGLRLAARTSEAVYQDYRQQLMLVVAEAELAYRDLAFAQEAYRLSGESVTMARSVLADNRARFDAGRGSQLEVLEAEAGLAMRLARDGEARQAVVETVNRLASYFSVSPHREQMQYVALDPPEAREVELSFDASAETALAMNAGLLKAQSQVDQERIRLAYAQNQRKPQLDIRGSFGATGLGFDWGSAWRDVEKAAFPSWGFMAEMRIPLLGGVRERNEVSAARNRLRQAELGASGVATRIHTELDAAVSRVDATFISARGYASVVDFRQSLLNDQIEAVEVGRIDTRTVLETEQELFQARLEQLRSEVEHQRALLELQILQGNLLQIRGLEIGFQELEERTSQWALQRSDRLELLRYHEPSALGAPVDAPIHFEGDPLEGPGDVYAEPRPARKFFRRPR